ncbi:MAG: hypothetical protein ABJZ91_09170, partial [Cyclobacteriaceae bacterium]
MFDVFGQDNQTPSYFPFLALTTWFLPWRASVFANHKTTVGEENRNFAGWGTKENLPGLCAGRKRP